MGVRIHDLYTYIQNKSTKPEGFNLIYPVHFPVENFIEFNTKEGKKDVKLHTYLYEPPKDIQPKGIIYLQHGLNTYIGEMIESAKALAEGGYICAGFDMKGYGQSEGIRAYFKNFDNLMNDLLAFIALTTPLFPPNLPKYLFGYSMGGCLAFYTAITHPHLVNGIISYAPAIAKPANFKPKMTKFAEKFEKPLRLIGKIPLTDIDLATITKDENIKYKLKNDPFIIQSKIRISNGLEFLRIQKWMDSHIQELQIPVIIWIGDKDEAVSPTGLQSLLEKANPSLVSFNILSGSHHDFLMHQESRDKAIKGIFQWLMAPEGGAIVN